MRIPSSAVFISSCLLAVAISLPALAQSPAANSQSQSTPAQNSPAPPPSAQQSTTGNNNQNHAPSQDAANPLNLTEEQKAKLRPIIMDENQQIEAVRNDGSLTQEQKIAKANQIRSEASPKIKAILTPEQLQKLAELQQERTHQQQQENQSAPPSTNPPSPQK
jgi:periplasmic protein CpxP/Spy